MSLHPLFPRPCSAFVGRSDALRRTSELLPTEVLFLVYGVAGIGKSEFVYRVVEAAQQTPQFSRAKAVLVTAQREQTGAQLVTQIQHALQLHSPVRRAPSRGTPDDFAALARILDDAAQPFLLCLDELQLLSEGAETLLSELLAFLSRHVRSSRIFVCARVELTLPASTQIPVVLRLPPLSTAESIQLADSLLVRLGPESAIAEDVLRTCLGSPLLIRQALLRTAGGDDSSSRIPSETLVTLVPEQRQILLLGRILSGRQALTLPELQQMFPSVTSLPELVRQLARRFLIDLDGGTIKVSLPLWNVLVSTWPHADLSYTRRSVASLLLGRFLMAPQRRAHEGIEAIKQLLLSGAYAQAVQVLRQTHRAISAAWLDSQLLDLLRTLRQELQAESDETSRNTQRVEVELLTARLLLRRSDVIRSQSIVESLRLEPMVLHSSRYHGLLGEICQRSGRLTESRRHFAEARNRADSPRELFRISLQFAQTLAHSGEPEQASQLLHESLTELTAPEPADTAYWQGALSLGLILEDRLSEAAEAARQALAILGVGGALGLSLALHEVIARVGCDDIGAARALVDRLLFQFATSGAAASSAQVPSVPMPSVPMMTLLRGVVLCAQGELSSARTVLAESMGVFEEQNDLLAAMVAGFYLGKALFGLGDLAGAHHVLTRTLAFSRQAGARPLSQRIELLCAQVLLGMAIPVAACTHVERVLGSQAPQLSARLRAAAVSIKARADALSALDAGALGSDAIAQAAACAMEQASAWSREAGRASEVSIDVERAELWTLLVTLPEPGLLPIVQRTEQALLHYAACECRYEEARAALALSGLLLCHGSSMDLTRADEALVRAQELSTRHAFGLLHLRGLLLEAVFARRQGNTRQMLRLLRQGVEYAGVQTDLLEVQLLREALRELDRQPGDPEERAPRIDSLLSRLGLRCVLPYEIIDRSGRREADEESRRRAFIDYELFIEPERGMITRGGDPTGAAIVGRPLLAALLAALLIAPTEGASAERLFYDVWGGREYHPLQHRNTIYVAIGRLRQAIRELLPGREIIETAVGGWRLSEVVSVCIIRKKSREKVLLSC